MLNYELQKMADPTRLMTQAPDTVDFYVGHAKKIVDKLTDEEGGGYDTASDDAKLKAVTDLAHTMAMDFDSSIRSRDAEQARAARRLATP